MKRTIDTELRDKAIKYLTENNIGFQYRGFELYIIGFLEHEYFKHIVAEYQLYYDGNQLIIPIEKW